MTAVSLSLDDEFQRDGYVLQRAVFSPEACVALNARLSELVVQVAEEHRRGERDMLSPWSTLRRSAHGLGVLWNAGPSATHLSEPQVMRVGHALHAVDARFDAACRHPGVGPVLERLASPDARIVSSAVIYKQPASDAVQFGLHRDAWFITTAPESLVLAFIALDPMDDVNGCLEVAPGSHHAPLTTSLTLTDTGFAPAGGDTPREPELTTRPLHMSRGDVAFVHGRTFHRSGPNHSEAPRRALIVHAMSGASTVTPSTWLQAPEGGFERLGER
ncbi:MAG: phytanoyl-CoA dioxygenase family protein [Sandaracinaceae bacterium]